MLVFGESGIGKTTLTKTLPITDDSKVLYVAADPGQLALRNRDFSVVEAPDGFWTEAVMEEVYKHARKNIDNIDWLVVDGLDELGDAVLKSKLRTERSALRAYGEMASFMEEWTKKIRDIKGCSILFITHIEQTQDNEGALQWGPSFPGKQFKEKLNDLFDLVGCMRAVRVEDQKVKRLIQFRAEADPRYHVKDRSGSLLDFEEPDLSAVFHKIHDAGFTVDGGRPEYLSVDQPESQEEVPTEEDIAKLAALCKEKGLKPVTVRDMAIEKYGKGPKALNMQQFNELLGSL